MELPLSVEQLFMQQAKKVSDFFKRYSKPVKLEIHLSGSQKTGYHLAYSVRLKDGSIVYASGKKRTLEALPHEVFKSFLRALKRERAAERKDHLVNKAKRLKKQMMASTQALTEMHSQQQQESFEFLVEQLLPSVKNYLRRRLKVFEVKGLIPEGKVSVKKVFEQFKTRLFELFGNRDEKLPMHLWAYRVADELLENTLKSQAWDGSGEVISFEELSAKQLREMEEEFSTDGDGDLVMIAELDDITYHLDDYLTDDINLVVNEEDKLLEALEQENPGVDAEQTFHRKTSAMLARMPLQDSSIFDLHILNQLSPEEIAAIKNMDVAQVQATIGQVKEKLRVAFRKAYLKTELEAR